MTSPICAVLILTIMSLASGTEDTPKAQPTRSGDAVQSETPLVEQLATLKGRIEARRKALSAELSVARTANKKDSDARLKANREILLRSKPDFDAIAEQVAGLVKTHPSDPAALEGILLVGPSFDDEFPKIILQHFLNDPRISQLCAELHASTLDSTKVLLTEIAARSVDRQARGRATYALGFRSCGLYREMVDARESKDTEQERFLSKYLPQSVYRQRLKARSIADSDLEPILAEGERYFAQALKEYPELASADGTIRLADKARAELAWIANVPKLRVGKVAPNIAGEDLAGKPLNLADYRGKVVVVCFWATTCGPCMEMVPDERALVKRLAGKPFAMIGVNTDEAGDRERVKGTSTQLAMTWPSFWDAGAGGSIQASYNVDHLPTIYVLDPKGVIRSIDVRGLDLDRVVDALLLEREAGAPRPSGN